MKIPQIFSTVQYDQYEKVWSSSKVISLPEVARNFCMSQPEPTQKWNVLDFVAQPEVTRRLCSSLNRIKSHDLACTWIKRLDASFTTLDGCHTQLELAWLESDVSSWLPISYLKPPIGKYIHEKQRLKLCMDVSYPHTAGISSKGMPQPEQLAWRFIMITHID